MDNTKRLYSRPDTEVSQVCLEPICIISGNGTEDVGKQSTYYDDDDFE